MQIPETTDRVTQFARKNLENKKEFGTDARLAFKRHLDDLEKSAADGTGFPFVFVPEKAEDIIELANKLTIAEGEGDEFLHVPASRNLFLAHFLGGYTKRQARGVSLTVMCSCQDSRGKVSLTLYWGLSAVILTVLNVRKFTVLLQNQTKHGL